MAFVPPIEGPHSSLVRAGPAADARFYPCHVVTAVAAGGDTANVVYADFRRLVAPFAVGNRHPRFFGRVHGGGTAVGMLGEMLAAGLNANCGGRDHAPIAVERQVIRWAAEMLGLPIESSGLIVTGTSIANFVAVLVARTAALGARIRVDGLGGACLVAYTSEAAHMCIGRALDMAGIGTSRLRLITCDGAGRMCVDELRKAIAADRDRGLVPFVVVGTAGSVDTGAIDDLEAIARCCREAQVWFHIDAAFGALAMLSPTLRPSLRGIEAADSVAFDFRKWAQVPFDAGCFITRDGATHRAAFARSAAYLQRHERGLAGGEPWPVDLGPDLSRGFRALKVWMTLKVFGADRLASAINQCCNLAQELANAVGATPELELAAALPLNIVCFRVCDLPDEAKEEIAASLQAAGEVVLSTTMLGRRRVLRAAIVNHRTTARDVHVIVPQVLDMARAVGGRTNTKLRMS